MADPAGIAVRSDLKIKRALFDQANISEARNRGIALAAGEVVAFIDDDAIAEPCWAAALAGAFDDPDVIAATGPVMAPDGVNWQAKAEWITPDGVIPLEDVGARYWLPFQGGALSTLGTNCAFRSTELRKIGGFDPLFAYHLDESDLNLRMAREFPARPSAYLPQARVIHLAASGTARSGGAPSDLFRVGSSEAVFAKRFGADASWKARLVERQRLRLLRAMVNGRLDPFEVSQTMATLYHGMYNGAAAEAAGKNMPMTGVMPPPFLPAAGVQREHVFFDDWHWKKEKLRKLAAEEISKGFLVSIMLWSPSFIPHREVFTDGGWWERRGGVWGAGCPQDSAIVPERRWRRMQLLVDYWNRTRK